MDHYQIIAERFQNTLESAAMSVDQLADPIASACELITQALLQDRKIISCGAGVDAALSQLFSNSLLYSLGEERPALPAISLGWDAGASPTAPAAHRFSHTLRALGQEGDVLLTISSAEPDPSVISALEVAGERGMTTVALCNANDIPDAMFSITINGTTRRTVVELHTMVLQTLCELIEASLFGTGH
ncbi:D-sedoheptulose-7-phosphate isomerase [Halioglobus maricola]|uniref:D-sedoheptulose-7-phosphate isomerase n=1 Tax=Halioglobus maricola TaxID=2601894 RepID=UPI0014796F73|nr:SIS domain-containing protein [Halioglobus maricola]